LRGELSETGRGGCSWGQPLVTAKEVVFMCSWRGFPSSQHHQCPPSLQIYGTQKNHKCKGLKIIVCTAHLLHQVNNTMRQLCCAPQSSNHLHEENLYFAHSRPSHLNMLTMCSVPITILAGRVFTQFTHHPCTLTFLTTSLNPLHSQPPLCLATVHSLRVFYVPLV
jgi:hypothetical protein